MFKMFLEFSLFLFCCLLMPLRTFGQQNCFTPNRSIGTCMPYKECTFLKKQLEKYGSNLPEEVVNYIRQARCYGVDNSTIHLCCDVRLNNTANSNPSQQSSVTNGTKFLQSNDNFNNVTAPTRFGQDNDLVRNQLISRGLSILNEISCGRTLLVKIAFGEAANLGEFPWMALLRYANNVEFQCGGSLITQRYVLTAAHCVLSRDKLIGVRLGEHTLSTQPDCLVKGPPRRQIHICMPPAEDYGIERVISHASFSKSRISNDIALIKLDRRVTISEHIVPICLPVTQQSQNMKLLQTVKHIIAGWGATENTTASNVLMKAKIPLLDNSVCQQTFPYITFTSNHICAGGELRVDNCPGDSGGPLFVIAPYKEKRQYVQYGIVAAGLPLCGVATNFPGVYTNVTDFLPWIAMNIDD